MWYRQLLVHLVACSESLLHVGIKPERCVLDLTNSWPIDYANWIIAFILSGILS